MTTTQRVALYARFSTDKQSAESADDQFRACEAYCEKQGWRVTHRYADPGISGAAIGNRPQYLRMTTAAKAREFEIVMALELARLSRSTGDLNKEIDRLVFGGIRVVTLIDNYDSARKGHKMQAGLGGIVGEAFREMVSERTTITLQHRAKSGRSAGGRAYGYVTCVREDGSKWWAINEEQAHWVRFIYERYAEGWAPRRIAAELNSRGVPSPGSSWKRVVRRGDGKWLDSTINGGILTNPLYNGLYVWGRSRFKKHPDTGCRLVVGQRDDSECERFPCPELRIVPEKLWKAVQARKRRRSVDTRPIHVRNPKYGRSAFFSRGGRSLRYPLSGLLVCGDCGSHYSMCDGRRYACSTFHSGGKSACANSIRVPRVRLQEIVVGALRTHLFTPERRKIFEAELTNGAAADARHVAAERRAVERRRAEAVKQRDNIMKAIKAGILTDSTKTELLAAEAAVTAATTALKELATPSKSELPAAIEEFDRMVDLLPHMLEADADAAREVLVRVIGKVKLVREKGRLWAELSTNPGQLLGLAAAAGPDGSGGRI
ncbi:MAG: recombinase family protein [Proteobacteria bacterium]|nr:recombinase family protein [Pseudomonadota bacterium]